MKRQVNKGRKETEELLNVIHTCQDYLQVAQKMG